MHPVTAGSLNARRDAELSLVDGHEVARTFPGVPDSVAEARHFARDVCDRWHISTGSDVELCVSEVVANAVEHGHGEIGLELVRTPWGVRVAVSDEERALPVVRPGTTEGEGGRGMAVVSALAVRWAARPTQDGKVVWFHISDRAG
jgi:anti-sigma regulatory factor (Ser/Thr protein kinase)